MIGDRSIRCMCTAYMDICAGEMCPLCESKRGHAGSPQRRRLEWRARFRWWFYGVLGLFRHK